MKFCFMNKYLDIETFTAPNNNFIMFGNGLLKTSRRKTILEFHKLNCDCELDKYEFKHLIYFMKYL